MSKLDLTLSLVELCFCCRRSLPTVGG